MNEEFLKECYLYLEELRKSGVVNMYGAAPYLAQQFDLDRDIAKAILREWMRNYNAIAAKYYK